LATRKLLAVVPAAALALASFTTPFAQDGLAEGQQTPILRLGPANGTLDEGFTKPSSIRELADGRVLVSDWRERRVVVADFARRAVTQVGRAGSGPDEYGVPGHLWPLPGDSTLMSDMPGRALLFASSRIVATIVLNGAATPGVPETVDGVDMQGSAIRVFWRTFGPTSFPGPRDSLVLTRHRRDGGAIDTIGALHSVGSAAFAGSGRAGGVGRPALPAPSESQRYGAGIDMRDQPVLFPDGWIAIARFSPYRVDWCPPRSACVAGAEIPFDGGPFTDRHKRGYLELMSRSAGFPPTTDISRVIGWPDSVPAFSSPGAYMRAAFAIPDGRLLIERFAEPQQAIVRRYDVVDRRGAVVARVELPPNERVVGFGARSVYTLRTDANDLQHVERRPWPAR
jgi:hypothetical protein